MRDFNTMIEIDYSDLEFDEEKYYLGSLCKRGHDWNDTGKSRRYKNKGVCVDCVNRKVENVCEYCTKKYLGPYTRKNVQRFCSRQCSTDWHREEHWKEHMDVCSQCGKFFKANKFGKNRRKYCTAECYHDSMRDEVVEKKCKRCGLLIRRPMWEMNQSTDNYCGRDCFIADQKYGNKMKDRSFNGVLTGIYIACDNCGAKIYRIPSKLREVNYCSRKCVSSSRTLERTRCFECNGLYKPSHIKQQFCSKSCVDASFRRGEWCRCGYCEKDVYRQNSNDSELVFCDVLCLGRYLGGLHKYHWIPVEEELERRSWTYHFRTYWKEVARLLDKNKCSEKFKDNVLQRVVKDIEARVLLLSNRNNNSREENLIMAIKQVVKKSEEHLLGVLNGENTMPRHERLSLQADFRSHLDFEKEVTKRVVVDELNNPQTPSSTLSSDGDWLIHGNQEQEA
jgi:hypothetical protein